MSITAELHDGTKLEFPDGTDPAVIQRTVKQLIAKEAPEPSMAERVGAGLRDIPRQVGLTARYGMEGLGRAAEVVTEPIRQLAVNPLLRAVGAEPAASTGTAASRLADAIGLPQPKDANERVIGDATRMVASAGGMAGAARAAAPMLQGTSQAVAQQLAARPAVQMAGAAGAGAAGGATREAGGGPFEQFAAALAGGLAAGAGAAKLGDASVAAGSAIKNAVTPRETQLQQADQQINLILQKAGVDWAAVPERVRQGMRDEVSAALMTGQPLSADATRRLLAFKATGTTPTVGMLTQDAGQITREMNLAKTGANSTSLSLQRLPAIQNENAAQLLRQLDEAGAANAPTAAGAAQKAIGSMQSAAAAKKGEIGALYDTARDSSGRSLPLDGAAWTKKANELLDQAMVGGQIPADVARVMNGVAKGEIPLTVEVAEQIKTRIGQLQRGASEGNTRYALGLVRQALDDAPLRSSGVSPGNPPAAAGSVPPSTAPAGEAAMKAFGEARSANRAWMQRVEGNPALKAVVDGVEPDQFVQKFLISKGASASDVRGLAGELDPSSLQAMKQYLAKYLRDAATNSTDDITKFSNDGYRRALRDIGEEKLAVFFDKTELQKLRDIGEAAKLMQAQPTGSAVNNSNSGALALGRGLDFLESIGSKLPLGLRDTITGTIQGAQQSQVLRPRNALMLAVDRQPARINPLLAITAASPVEARKDDRRN